MKSRAFAMVLYPQEDETHYTALLNINKYYKYAFIEHNADIYTEDTEEHKKGEEKKSHIHVVIKFDNARSISKVAEEIGITENYIQKCNFVAYTRYLIHKDDPKKYQYKEKEIMTNIPEEVKSALSLKGDYKRHDANMILEYIENNRYITFKSLVSWARENRNVRRNYEKCVFLQKYYN